MTTFVDFERGNFNGDNVSVGDLLFFKDDGAKAIWLENGAGGRLATSPAGFNLPFTGLPWHVAALLRSGKAMAAVSTTPVPPMSDIRCVTTPTGGGTTTTRCD